MSLAFRCYAYGRGQDWEAICVDLDIAVFGSSVEEVKASLDTCIQMYLERVFELPPAEQRPFLTRKAPWHVRTRLAFMTWLHSLRGDHGRSRSFSLQLHIPAH